ncbi:hypothetical protein GE300_16465 [Rhodobacteraceae bacterium 2CG4]|uniref:Uncharacterized protein n=1 Tax=Halovulum marinum TaxID=2662447 RepID=A0A6L5Z3N0_9RHOB|nr:hypothetical protein [Halovulum marinum]MSU91183.1 hypothetical protein [Halovulum marinum]
MTLRQAEVLRGQGLSVAEAVRQFGVTQQTCYRRREKGGLSWDPLKRLKVVPQWPVCAGRRNSMPWHYQVPEVVAGT